MESIKDLDDDELNDLLEKSEQDLDYSTASSILLLSLSEDKDENLCEAVCDVIFRLSSNATGRDSLGKSGVCETILMLIAKYTEEASIIEVALGIIKNLATDNNDNQLRFNINNLNICELIIKCMKFHSIDEATLQEQACLAIESLAVNCPENKAKFLLLDTIDVLNKSKELITNERNKTYPDRALSSLIE